MINKFKKHLRKYIAVALTFLMIPLCSIRSFAYEKEYLSYPWFSSSNAVYYGSSLNTVLSESYEMTHSTITNVFTYEFTSSSAVTFNSVFIGNEIYDFLYPYDPDRYTYKFVGSFVFDYGDFNPSTVQLKDIKDYVFSDGQVISSSSVQNLLVDKVTNTDGVFFNFSFDLNDYSNLSVLEFVFNPPGSYTNREKSRIKFTGSVIAVPVDTSAESTDAIIDAIHDQTDVIENGNDETQDAVSDFEEVFDDFNEELENIEDFDNQVIEDFTAANDEYLSQLEDFSLTGSLFNAANWLSISMQDIYDNSSDYKMLWLVPLLLGVPLMILFLKKGGDNE